MQGQAAARTNMSALDFEETWQTRPNDYPELRALTDSPDMPSQDAPSPVADAGSPVTVDIGTNFSLDGTNSSDSETRIVSYEWDIDGDGTYELTGPQPTYSYDDSGIRAVTLRVTDSTGSNATDITTVTAIDSPVALNAGELPGSGTKSDPYRISNVSELQAMDDDLDAHYELVADIDASATDLWNDGRGFKPIGGTEFGSAFTGSFDGNNHTIIGLTIDRPDNTLTGLFNTINNGGVVKRMSIQNANVTGYTSGIIAARITSGGVVRNASVDGNVIGVFTVGGAVGSVESGRLENVSATANVQGQDSVGGLTGRVTKSLYDNPSVVRSSEAQGDVSGQESVGGFVGLLSDDSVIRDSAAESSVSGTTDVGGFVGRIEASTIERSSASGSATATGRLGGFAGIVTTGPNGRSGEIVNSYTTASIETAAETQDAGGFAGVLRSGTVASSYAAGSITGLATQPGGFAGNSSDVTVTAAYWDEQATGQTTTAGSATALATAEMQGQAARTNMSGLDFEHTWQTRPNDYPALRALTDSQDTTPEIRSAVQYRQADGSPAVEVAFSEPVQNLSGNYELYADGAQIDTSNTTVQIDDGRAVIKLDRVIPSELTLQLQDGVVNSDGVPLDTPQNVSVARAPVSVHSGDNMGVYRGSTLAVVTDTANSDVTISQNGTLIQALSTGSNSRIALLDTEAVSTGDYQVNVAGVETSTFKLLRLEFTASVDSSIVNTSKTLSGTIQSNVAAREIRIGLVNESSSSVVVSRVFTLDGQGEAAFSFDLAETGISAGDYQIRVTDRFTGIQRQVAEINVTSTDDDSSDGGGGDGGGDGGDGGGDDSPTGDMIVGFSETTPLGTAQVQPDSLSGKIRTEQGTADNISVELLRSSQWNYSLAITGPEDAENVTVYLQVRAISSSQDIENLTVFVNETQRDFEVSTPGNSPWVGFAIPHFSTQVVTITSGTELYNTSLSPTTIQSGESVTVEATLENTGSESQTVTLNLTDNGTQIGTQEVTVDGGQKTTVTFTPTLDEQGTHELAISGLYAGNVTVEEQSDTITTTEEETSSEAPGFGPIATLAALLALTLLILRRRG
jgi:PGF-CTERM protein